MTLDISVVVGALVGVLNAALPIAIIFTLGNVLVRTFLNAAFGGKLEF